MNLQGEWQGRIPALILAFSSRRFSTELASTSAPVVCSKQHPRVALKSWHRVLYRALMFSQKKGVGSFFSGGGLPTTQPQRRCGPLFLRTPPGSAGKFRGICPASVKFSNLGLLIACG